MTDHRDRLLEIARDIDSLAASLDEISFDVLREARRETRSGDGRRPDLDRTITQARRALEKASRLLSGSDARDED
jgi:hypothetical protein